MTDATPRALVRASGGPRYAVALGVDALGTGMLRPFLLLYGLTVLRLSAPVTGVAMTVAVVTGLACMPAVGRWIDRGARSTVVAASMLVRVAGVAVLLATPEGTVWMFAAAALLTQILSDSATTVLLGPIAISLAGSLGLPPTPFVVCTALGAVVAFLTPIGHHGNLLILGPGQYRFADFLRVGLPLTTVIALVSAWMARWLWLGGPLLPTFGG